jgi:hypothetical protein
MQQMQSWDQSFDTSRTNEALFHLARYHAEKACDHPQADEVRRLITAHDFKSLCLFELETTGCSVESYRHLRQVLAFFAKRDDIDIGVDKQQVAWGSFLEAEELCRQTNAIFRKYEMGAFKFRSRVEAVLYTATQKISQILGDCPSFDDLQLRFGPGATTQVKKKDASARRKLAQVFSCSDEFRRVLIPFFSQVPDWSGVNPDILASYPPVSVSTGRVEFVPKNAKTLRTIGKEPTLNGMVQLGVGAVIAERLRRAGVDIRDQTLNQRLAQEGSKSGALATLDLKSASGTIATGLVLSLLPIDWFSLLESVRTRTAETPDGVKRLEQFSSMGNGFTFPLETLLFFSLVSACCEQGDTVSVYGDDIILPVSRVPLALEVLTACGFIVNPQKSFWSGPFRESCGKDFLFGLDVRPAYVKRALSGADLFVLHNHYVRRGELEPAMICRSWISDELAIYGPDGYGDGHLLGDYYRVPSNRQHGWSGYTFDTYTYKSRHALYSLGADYVYPCYSIYLRTGAEDFGGALQHASVRGLFRRFRRHSTKAGSFRPDLEQSVYKKDERGRVHLRDTLPGVDGYKRRKIYVLG